MQIVLIYGIVILTAGSMYVSAQLTHRLTRPRLWSALAVALATYSLLLWTKVTPWPISDIAIMVVAILAASAISLTLTSSSALMAFCLTAGIVDVFSFSGGLTAKIMADYEQGRNLLLQYLCITVPLFNRVVPIIGIGDLIIMGSVYCALFRLGHHGWLAFLFPLSGLLIALAIGLLVGGIYALPFIGGTTIVYLLWKAKTRSSLPVVNAGSG